MAIKGYFGPHRWLSNFGEGVCFWSGIRFPFRENAFQFAKGYLSNDLWENLHRFVLPLHAIDGSTVKQIYTPKEAKMAGKKLTLPQNWTEAREEVMFSIVMSAMSYPPNGLREKLLNTGDEYLEESNYWHDVFWGVCCGKLEVGGKVHVCYKGEHEPVGENKLGKIHMAIRDLLKG